MVLECLLHRLAAAILFTSVLGGAAHAGEKPVSWPQDAFNPHPIQNDLILPMPCGGAMAFRRVDTFVGATWAADQKIRMGTADPDLKTSESLRFDYLVGGFSDRGTPEKRFYYIGKYEVTEGQYNSVMGEACTAYRFEDTLPKQRITWLDAINFAQNYTQWLNKEARDTLPREDNIPGFLRLPTETEWEYAARGGSMLLPSQELDRLFPMDGSVRDYGWFAGQQSCNGRVQPIGLLKANPLGLHDVIGNVAEMTLDLYRGTAPGRLHGQAGGVVARGGSCLTNESRARVSDRREEVFFNVEDGTLRRSLFLGMRLVIGAPVNTSQERMNAFAESAVAPQTDATPSVSADPVTALQRIAAEADHPADAQRLNRLASDIAVELARRREIEANGARMAVMAGAMLMRSYRLEMDEIARRESMLPDLPDQLKQRTIAGIDTWKARAKRSGDAYLSLVIEAADTYSPTDLRAQLPRLADALRYDGSASVIDMAKRFISHCERRNARTVGDYPSLLREALSPL